MRSPYEGQGGGRDEIADECSPHIAYANDHAGNTLTDTTVSRFGPIIALIGIGHAASHFAFLTVQPLFPLLKVEFGVSYAALGLIMTAMSVASGIGQIPAGFLVDRIGARPVLVAGVALTGLGIAVIGLAPSYWAIVAGAALSGLGNSVFHPADYAILNGSVATPRIGRAFSLHTFAGYAGFALAPMTMTVLAAELGWRPAVVGVGLAIAAIAVPLLLWGHWLQDDTTPSEVRASAPAATARMLLAPQILILFGFYVLMATVTSGMHAFGVSAMVDHHGLALGTANSVLTVFLVVSTLGILLGGPLADRTTRHGLVTAIGLILGAIVLFAVAGLPLGAVALGLSLGFVGLMLGAIRPTRDMMVRAATPPGASGRVFGFVMTGLNVGAAVTPVLFGLILDTGRPNLVFVLMGVVLVLSLGTIGLVRRRA